MKKMISLFVISICFVILIGYSGVSAQITDHIPDGYSPIYSIEDLYGINNNLDGKYILMADIDMSATAPGGDWDFGNGWKPIGSDSVGFCGEFDGNGHKISNMNIYGDISYYTIGLFASVSINGRVKNLGIEDMNINVNSDITFQNYHNRDVYKTIYVGGIAGGIYDDHGRATIENCYSTGDISVNGAAQVGGICGTVGYTEGYGTVNNCYSLAYIDIYPKQLQNEESYVGGIVGRSNAGDIANCYFAGAIGGLGMAYAGLITGNDCYVRNVYCCLSDSVPKGRAEGLTNAQMKKKECYTGFDFDEVWFIDEYSSYPYPQLWLCPQVKIQSLKVTSLPKKLSYESELPIYSIYYGNKYGFEFVSKQMKDFGIALKDAEFDLSGGSVSLTYDDGYISSVKMEECYKGAFFAEVCELKNSEQIIRISYDYPNTNPPYFVYDEFSVIIEPKEEILTITSKTDEIVVGESFIFNAEYSRSGNIQYISSNSKVLKINKTTGEATAVKAGKATVTVKAGSLSKDIEVTVVKEKAKSNDGKDSKSEKDVITSDTVEPDFEMEVGEAFKLAVKKISSKKLSSSDKSVVTISKKGTVKAIAPGTATITIKDKSTKKVVAKYIITVISEEEPDFELEAGETMRVALKTGYSMKSSNENIVSIGNKGKITGVKVGTATVTVYDKAGKEIEKYLVQVVK